MYIIMNRAEIIIGGNSRVCMASIADFLKQDDTFSSPFLEIISEIASFYHSKKSD